MSQENFELGTMGQWRNQRPAVSDITDMATRFYGYSFSESEIREIALHTLRKLIVARKNINYFGILFENELRDFCMRKCYGG